jgi:ribosomal small subunit protein bTHX
MGKGDIKSKRGKISNGSYGVSRKRKKDAKVGVNVATKPAVIAESEVKVKAAVKPVAKKKEKAN